MLGKNEQVGGRRGEFIGESLEGDALGLSVIVIVLVFVVILVVLVVFIMLLVVCGSLLALDMFVQQS